MLHLPTNLLKPNLRPSADRTLPNPVPQSNCKACSMFSSHLRKYRELPIVEHLIHLIRSFFFFFFFAVNLIVVFHRTVTKVLTFMCAALFLIALYINAKKVGELLQVLTSVDSAFLNVSSYIPS